MDAIITYLAENWISGIWLIVGGAIVWIYWDIKNKAGKAKDKAEDAHSKIGELPCDRNAEKISNIETVNVKIEERVIEIRDRISELPCEKHAEKISVLEAMNAKLDGMMQVLQSIRKGNENSGAMFQSQSPINLTEYGQSIIDSVNAMDYIDSNWEMISGNIEKNAVSKNPYDIQQYCFDYVLLNAESVLSKEGHDKAKTKAYELGIPIINILQAAAILIRNKYFEGHDMNIADIDEHDPNKS